MIDLLRRGTGLKNKNNKSWSGKGNQIVRMHPNEKRKRCKKTCSKNVCRLKTLINNKIQKKLFVIDNSRFLYTFAAFLKNTNSRRYEICQRNHHRRRH
jgi:hypothetical protein